MDQMTSTECGSFFFSAWHLPDQSDELAFNPIAAQIKTVKPNKSIKKRGLAFVLRWCALDHRSTNQSSVGVGGRDETAGEEDDHCNALSRIDD